MTKLNDKIERILNELSKELSCWECWHDSEECTDCDCQTCRFTVTYNKIVEIANEE